MPPHTEANAPIQTLTKQLLEVLKPNQYYLNFIFDTREEAILEVLRKNNYQEKDFSQILQELAKQEELSSWKYSLLSLAQVW